MKGKLKLGYTIEHYTYTGSVITVKKKQFLLEL